NPFNAPALLNQFIQNFGIGVDIFFLLSGFLITYILLSEKKQTGSINIVYFLIRRSFRIWPLYFFIIGITPFIVQWLDAGKPEYWSNLLFINNFRAIETGLWTYPFSHFWSICIEEHFYLVWPFILAFIPKDKLLATFYSIIALSILFRLYYSFSTADSYAWIYLHTISRIDVMVIGGIIAFYYSEKTFQFKLSNAEKIMLFGVLLSSLFIEQYSNWGNQFMAGFKKYFYMGTIGLLMLDYNFNPTIKFRLSNFSIINYLGKVSYGIYMYHNVLTVIIIKKVMYNINSSSALLYFTLMIVSSIVVPIISYELFEKHFLRIGSRFRVRRS
ncbi:MAG: acyltransferase, partial [Bacteroidia bacterium]|nr:acyltransferase [Bacteroidia bacterium]